VIDIFYLSQILEFNEFEEFVSFPFDEKEIIDNMMPSFILSIDFFDAIISDELIRIIENWYESRKNGY
jgi:hypothetical protein